APGWLDRFLEGDSFRFEVRARGLEGRHFEGEVTPAGEAVLARGFVGGIRRIDLDEQAAQVEKVGGRRLGHGKDQARPEHFRVPILEFFRIAGREADVFERKHNYSETRETR